MIAASSKMGGQGGTDGRRRRSERVGGRVPFIKIALKIVKRRTASKR
jgi:hypothetical protein